jgi:dihydrodipicolinate synthase/N-acetylneuraminate lyase
MTSLTKLVKDLNSLEAELRRFETRFGVKSREFYEAMMRGDLEEFDALDDYRMEFIEWLALYKTWLSLDDKYHQLIARQPVVIQIKANLEPVHA